MKKTLSIILLCFICALSVNSQVMRVEELEKYAKEKYGDKWTKAASNLAKTLTLDKNKALTYTEVIEAPGKTKEQLYIILNYWYSATFNSGKASVQLNNKKSGVIIGKGCIEKIAYHAGGMNEYYVNLEPLIKTDIKDGKIRVTYSLPYYPVTKVVGGGFISVLNDGTMRFTQINENWVLDECFPFVSKDSHKKASAKALIMAHAYSNVIMDKIEEVVKNGLVGNETEDW